MGVTYLDHAATAPMRQVAIDAMLRVMQAEAGNPTGSHRTARDARKVVDDARDLIAGYFGAEPAEVVFTAGGTEADNLALHGRSPVICSEVEHHAVLEPVQHLGGTHVPVDSDGVIDLEALERMVGPETQAVSLMLANNETGVVQPLHRVARIVRKVAPSALIHTDAVQAAPWLDVARMGKFADAITISAHKLGGPMGVGALIIRNPHRVNAQLLGGGQEQERRSGTHNVAAIAGFAAAVEELGSQREAEAKRVAALRDQLLAGLAAEVPGLAVTAGEAEKLPNFAHVCIADVESEALLIILDDLDVQASAGASCSSGALQHSHVLEAMGVERRLVRGALRLTLGRTTTSEDVDHTVAAVRRAVEQLRGYVPERAKAGA